MELKKLKPEFKSLVEKVLEDCEASGVVMKPYFALRTPAEQARLWRQSRTTKQVISASAMLRSNGAHWISRILENVGPCYGKWATNALPGQSWHQFGEAIDCAWIVEGGFNWNVTDKPNNGYKVYASIAKAHGLYSLGESMGDWVHIQLQPYSKPNYDWVKIDQLMQEKYA